MRKLVLLGALALTMSVSSFGNTNAIDCEQMAADLLEVHEGYFGCLDAETYNTSYTLIVAGCEQSEM